MEFILKDIPVVEGGDSTRSSTRRISALNDEARDQTVEDCVGVVAIETMLEEIARGEGCLFGEEFESEVA